MANEDEVFLQSIADSDDDEFTPSLVYANWLNERGDTKGEYIQLDCDYEKTSEELRQLQEHLRQVEERRQVLFECIWLQEIQDLLGCQLTAKYLTTRHGLPYFLEINPAKIKHLPNLALLPATLQSIKLRLTYNNVSAVGTAMMHFRGIKFLDIDNATNAYQCDLTAEMVEHLFTNPGFQNLYSLSLGRIRLDSDQSMLERHKETSVRIKKLVLNGTTTDGMLALLASTALSEVEHLKMTRVHPEPLPYLKNLRFLYVGAWYDGLDKTLRAINPINLPELEEIEISGLRYSRYPGQYSPESLRERLREQFPKAKINIHD